MDYISIIKYLIKKVRENKNENKILKKRLDDLMPVNIYKVQHNKQDKWLNIEDWQLQLINSKYINKNKFYHSICKYENNYYCYAYDELLEMIILNLNTNEKIKIKKIIPKSHKGIQKIENSLLKNINKILQKETINNIDDILKINTNINNLEFIIKYYVQLEDENKWNENEPLNWHKNIFDLTMENYFYNDNKNIYNLNIDSLNKLLLSKTITICEYNNIKYLCYYKETEYLNILNLSTGENKIIALHFLPKYKDLEIIEPSKIEKIINYIKENMTNESTVTVNELDELLSQKK